MKFQEFSKASYAESLDTTTETNDFLTSQIYLFVIQVVLGNLIEITVATYTEKRENVTLKVQNKLFLSEKIF